MQAPTAVWNCQYCPCQQKTYREFQRHVAKHRRAFSALVGLECPVCGSIVKRKCNMRAHLNVHAKPFQCSLCPRRFARKGSLETHLIRHAQGRVFMCAAPGCGSLAAKEPATKGPRCCGVHCPVCNKWLKHKGSLKLHLKIHDKRKDHECAICHWQFIQKINLQTHMRQHTGERPYTCKQKCCTKTFASYQAQRAHWLAYVRQTTKPVPKEGAQRATA